MQFESIHIAETDSTNRWLRAEGGTLSDAKVVVADYQTAGRGQGTNTWESERGMNLTCSIGLCPEGVKASRQFLLSMAISVALTRTLQALPCPISIKWPNDIYAGDKKICGILIENTLQGDRIKDCIIGIGLNVNQRVFVSDAPNPTSMALESGHDFDREEVLRALLGHFGQLLTDWDEELIRATYRQLLYRREGVFPYRDGEGYFRASLAGVEDDGHLLLQDTEGRQRRYAFKEVTFVIEHT